jgi:hypothetical protein
MTAIDEATSEILEPATDSTLATAPDTSGVDLVCS